MSPEQIIIKCEECQIDLERNLNQKKISYQAYLVELSNIKHTIKQYSKNLYEEN